MAEETIERLKAELKATQDGGGQLWFQLEEMQERAEQAEARGTKLKVGLAELQAMLSCSPQHPFCRNPRHANPDHHESHVTEVRSRIAALEKGYADA